MIGVTVGIGRDAAGAEEAAARFRKYTGLSALVLGDEEFRKSGLRLPHMLRLHLFDFIDEETAVYFDADLWYQRPWNPREFNNGQIHVVRDLTYTAHIIKDASSWGVPVHRYFNSGFMIVNRQHDHVLKQAAHLMQMYSDKLPTLMFEQAPLNAAVYTSGAPVTYLDRRYNWVQCSLRWMEKGIPVIAAHKYVPDQKGLAMFDTVVDEEVTRAKWDVKNNDFKELAGIYSYARIGYDSRMLELLPDGTIGRGRANFEQWWLPMWSGDTRQIMLFGFPANNMHWEEEICILTEDDKGFGGYWNKHEEMPIRLEIGTVEEMRGEVVNNYRSHRAGVLIDLLMKRPQDSRRFAEIGVWEGETSQALLTAVPGIQYHMVDPWSVSTKNHTEYKETKDHVAKLTQYQMNTKNYQALRRTAFAQEGLHVHRMESERAANLFFEGYFDMAFIDADHSYQAVVQDITSWWPKIRSGGILAGHDYDYPTADGSTFGPQVKRAVDEFVSECGLDLHTDKDYTWYVYKP